jgi:outer membrane protein assembly factor BamB
MNTRLICFALAIASPVAMADTACTLTVLPITGHIATAPDISFDLGDADDAQHPSAWQGPIKVTQKYGQACAVDDEVAIIERPLLFGASVLYVPTYSGSENRVYAIDTKTCKVLWKSQTFTGKTAFKAGRLIYGTTTVALGKDCSIAAH